MKKRKLSTMAVVFLASLLLAGGVLAMSSDNYRLDWFTLAGCGGGPSGSGNYAVNLTVGQTAIGVSSSSNYQVCLGYWCETAGPWRIYLPLVLSG
jgi:hypothetical protein